MTDGVFPTVLVLGVAADSASAHQGNLTVQLLGSNTVDQDR